ncbi:MAG: type IV pilus twitching motility protein PilT [Planctomycetota bacterium]|jgi:twitching motility protein PilT
MVLIDRLLETVITQGASDLHLVVGRPPVLRLHQRLRSLNTKVLTPEDCVSLMKSITPERCQQELQETGTTDFGFAFEDRGRFRVSVFKQRGNVSVALRLIPTKLLTFEEIGLPPQVKPLMFAPRGLFLVTGPTGCGKTTTLATMIDYINSNIDRHIITVEDPIEYYHDHKKSIINQREVGVDVPSFAEALRRVLRMDPDVILVGEMRDLETIQAAITAAETGHLVFGTLHTTGAEGTVNRIIDAFPTDQQEQVRVQLSVSIIAIISQQLLPRAASEGLIAAYEFLVTTPAIRNLIRESKTYRIDSTIQTGRKFGMVLLDDHLYELYQRGLITMEDAIFKAKKPAELEAKIRQKSVVTDQEGAGLRSDN